MLLPAMPWSRPHTLKMLFPRMLWKHMLKTARNPTMDSRKIPTTRNIIEACQNPLAISVKSAAYGPHSTVLCWNTRMQRLYRPSVGGLGSGGPVAEPLYWEGWCIPTNQSGLMMATSSAKATTMLNKVQSIDRHVTMTWHILSILWSSFRPNFSF